MDVTKPYDTVVQKPTPAILHNNMVQNTLKSMYEQSLDLYLKSGSESAEELEPLSNPVPKSATQPTQKTQTNKRNGRMTQLVTRSQEQNLSQT
jgi:hypothetical protein